MVISQDQNAGQSHIIKNDNRFFEIVAEFMYLGTTLRNPNSFQEDIKRRLKSGNACLSLGAESFVFQFAIQKYTE